MLNTRPPRIVTLMTLCLLLPVMAHSRDSGQETADKAVSVHDLTTHEEFIEYAHLFGIDIHDLFFSIRLYEGTRSCLTCHGSLGAEALDMGHFKWAGPVENIVGLEGKTLGKYDLLNNFCVAVPSNEGRCTQCHIGLGWTDDSFDFNDPEKVDCLVCHDQSGSYAKGKKTGGMPEAGVDLNVVARSVAIGSRPTRKACIGCHAKAGGGDNVKHGDLSTDLVSTTREYDVHMGMDGGRFVCVDCHATNHDPKTGKVNHGNPGMALHSVHEGEMRQCASCHGSQETIHAGSSAEAIFERQAHERLACQVCHIPEFARAMPTKTEWYWEDAGKRFDPPPPADPVTGKPTWDNMKGSFVWEKDVRPALRWYNGKWNRKVINHTDGYDAVPIDMGSPVGSYDDPASMIYPFKKMIGNQPVDTVNKTVLVPHLFGMKGGPNPFWGKFDWGLALQDGAAYAGQAFSGTYGFEETFMYLTVNHEIAPAERALGMGGMAGCPDCHGSGRVEWDEIGWTADPFDGGTRTGAAAMVKTKNLD